MTDELEQLDTDCDLASARIAVSRDPRINPAVGDVLHRWGQDFTVDRVTQGLVRLVFPEWEQGILFFQRWAKDAEVVHVAPVGPPADPFIPESGR